LKGHLLADDGKSPMCGRNDSKR